MNANANAVRAGIRRGLIEFGISCRTPSEALFMLIGVVAVGVVLWVNRADELAPGVPAVAFIVPSILTIQLAFVAGYGLATVIVTEREDGTLIRARSLPTGLRSYATARVTSTMCELLATVGVTIVIVALMFGPALGLDVGDVLLVAGLFVLGTIALTMIGFTIGAAFTNPRSLAGWGFLALGVIIFVGGLVVPLANLPVWVQIIGQATPLYWIGHGMREAFLPVEMAALEIGGEWRPGVAFAVVGAWAFAGLVLAPSVLRRVARRETGSLLEARREAALQRV